MPHEKQIKHDDVLNADEASTWLKIPKSTLYKLCSEGELPAAKVGRHWRFHRETLEQWLLEKTQRPQADDPEANSEE
ncbi:MAG: helix-turn-helix domain-containing protein [bacterium]